MSDEWAGRAITIDCGEALGTFQGRVANVNQADQTITLVNAFQNGSPVRVPSVTIRACDIRDLKILDIQLPDDDNTERPASRENHLNSEERITPGILYPPLENKKDHNRGNKKFVERNKQLNDECFNNTDNNYILEHDFDFEKNLALFEKIKADLRGADSKQQQQGEQSKASARKYRCDQNVLTTEPVLYRQIKVEEAGEKEYVTDSGLVVPTITMECRKKLLQMAEYCGLSAQRYLEIYGRGASEMIIQLLGGVHRLNPQNTHQRPSVVLLCGLHWQGTQALNCGRHLANHGVNVFAFYPDNAPTPRFMDKELDLLHLAGGKSTNSLSGFQGTPVDMVVNALEEQEGGLSVRIQPWFSTLSQWVGKMRAPVLGLDPPHTGVSIPTKWSLVPVLPLSMHESCGSIYLCEMGIPKGIFTKVGITYSSPFGPKNFTSLHPNSVLRKSH